MHKKWKLKEQVSEELEEQLFSSLNIGNEDEKRKFFNPDYEKDLYDPFLLLNMDKTVERILLSIKKKEKIVLFGDYDADGVCSTVIFHDFFKKIGFENFDVYIPDRNKEGYGLNMEAIDEFIKNKVNLIITIDCGISDYEEIKKANDNKIEVIIIDHHLAPKKLPPAFSIVDPKQEKDNYPFDMLCGAAVAFKTVQALIEKGEFNIVPGWEKWLLNLVAIATVADMVPLKDENRILVIYGLQVLRKTYRTGLLVLFDKLRIKKENIMEDDIGFLIAPRINIASRMEHANTSYELLITPSSEEANWIVKRLDGLNMERRKIVDEILLEVERRVEKQKEKPVLIAEGDLSWNVGVLGLTANRLLEKYNCPIFLWGKGELESIKGSCRSDGSINLVDLMTEAGKEFFVEHGGHAVSAGFTVVEDRLKSLKDALLDAFGKIEKKEIEDAICIDREEILGNLNWNFVEIIEKFGPFGKDNPKPNFLFKDLEVCNVKMFGNGGIHLQLDFARDPGVISAIGFFMKNGKDVSVKKGDIMDLVASIEKSTFKGFKELRLRIVDFKIK